MRSLPARVQPRTHFSSNDLEVTRSCDRSTTTWMPGAIPAAVSVARCSSNPIQAATRATLRARRAHCPRVTVAVVGTAGRWTKLSGLEGRGYAIRDGCARPVRDPRGFVPVCLELFRNLLRCLPRLKRTHPHTVKPYLLDRGCGDEHRIAGSGELVRQGAGFF